MTNNDLLKAAVTVAAILDVVIEMSDDVLKARGALDAQGRLLRLQNSIQKNKNRVRTHAATLAAALAEVKS